MPSSTEVGRVNGFLNVFKPTGVTSHDVVARVRRLTRESRVGHAGTLDPEASGVLPVAVGYCTRLLPFLVLTPKVYQASVTIGQGTVTGDQQGRVVMRSARWPVTLAALQDAARWLTLAGWQTPSRVSAIKVHGERAYRLVQQGSAVWPAPRRVKIRSIDAIQLEETGWRFTADVGNGTYIRALVRDWAEILGIAAHVRALQRVRVGPWQIQESVAWEALDATWSTALEPWAKPWPWPVRTLEARTAERVAHGDPTALRDLPASDSPLMALEFEGELLAVIEGPPWRYRAVFKGEMARESQRR
ncbi:MAG: tRNA pseudouridine(55) synthase TruB [Firmicutes bacterium]|nr:tRNA pseudouridine(55) synthase TruB [Bacillota bacterium]